MFAWYLEESGSLHTFNTLEAALKDARESEEEGVMVGPMVKVDPAEFLQTADVIDCIQDAVADFWNNDDVDVESWIPKELEADAEAALDAWCRKYVRIDPTEYCNGRPIEEYEK